MTTTDDNARSTRRHFLASAALGGGPLALACFMAQQADADTKRPELQTRTFDLTPKKPPSKPRATAMISLFMQGGPSQMDLLDPKPLLNKLHMQKFPGEIKYDNAAQASSLVFGSPWKFKKYGEHGTDVSELLPHFSTIVDDALVIRSMHSGVNNHGQAIYAINSGRPLAGRPSLGSWLTYALGAESQSLPAYVAMTDPKGLPVAGVLNWSNGWLPSLFQGTVVRPIEPRILNLQPPTQYNGEIQANYLQLLASINRRHAQQRRGEHELQARIANFELAERMQFAADEATDLSRESKATHEMYGLHQDETREFGQRCLIARRLIEPRRAFCDSSLLRISTGITTGGIVSALPAPVAKIDQPAAALVKDLKQRGLLDSTIVHWGGEMGRLPVIQNEANIGRDHNTYGFTMWVAGGGFRAGMYGQTDEFGHRAVENTVNHFDYHATLLHLFGVDAQQLTYEQNGREQSLIDGQPASVVEGLLA
ncbi:MAG: DUF1501 domain-containing protein [Pirellulaceae bacterium]